MLMNPSSENLPIFLHAPQVLHVTCHTFNGTTKFGKKGCIKNKKHIYAIYTFPISTANIIK
jgi:hypothetical protein